MFKKGFKLFEGHGEPVMEVGGGEDTGIEVTVAHDADVGEAGLKVLIGHRTRILELAEDGIIEATEIAFRDELLEHVLAFIGNAVFLAREPTKEVSRAIVEFVRNDVVTDADVDFSGSLVY